LPQFSSNSLSHAIASARRFVDRRTTGVDTRPPGAVTGDREFPPTPPVTLDFVTDQDLEKVVAWQDVEWKANLEAARKIEAVETRLKNGARLVARNFYFDRERRMVRSRKDSAQAAEGEAVGRLAQLQARIQRAATPEELWMIAGEIGSATQRARPVLVAQQRPRAVKSKRCGMPDSRATMTHEPERPEAIPGGNRAG
jgi:hypothetical protein